MKSLRELFRIGHGPSSSHTMAPASAAEMFLLRHSEAKRFEVILYGSLAATGRGHFTDLAISDVLGAERTVIVWKPEIALPFHPNGMTFRALNGSGEKIAEWTVYSVGGGALKDAIGIPEEQLREAATSAVCKINIDSDGRLAMTAAVREVLATKPAEFDPRKYLGPARESLKKLYMHKVENVLGSAFKA